MDSASPDENVLVGRLRRVESGATLKDDAVVGVTQGPANGQQSEMAILDRGDEGASLSSERVRAEYGRQSVETGEKRMEMCWHCCHSNLLRWRKPCLDAYHCLRETRNW